MAQNLLFLSGSIRKGSHNTRLARLAHSIALDKGADAVLIDLADYPMPLFNADDEAEHGVHENAIRLKEKFAAADGFFIASPEYNSSMTPLLKNTLDWISRKHEKNEPPLVAFADKAGAISGTSPGALGAIRTLVPLRLMLSNVGVNLVGRQLAIPKAKEAFDENGGLVSDFHRGLLDKIITTLIRIS